MALDIFGKPTQQDVASWLKGPDIGQTDFSVEMGKTKGLMKGTAAGSDSLMTTLFGNSEQVGAIPGGVGALSGIVQGWLGYENLQLAQDSFALQKKAFEENMAKTRMEAGLKLDAMQRGLAKHGISSDVVNNYAKKYK